MATDFNPHEELGRTRKAARIAVQCVKYGHDELPEDPGVDNTLRAIAAGLGLNYPSDATLAIVRQLVNGTWT